MSQNSKSNTRAVSWADETEGLAWSSDEEYISSDKRVFRCHTSPPSLSDDEAWDSYPNPYPSQPSEPKWTTVSHTRTKPIRKPRTYDDHHITQTVKKEPIRFGKVSNA